MARLLAGIAENPQAIPNESIRRCRLSNIDEVRQMANEDLGSLVGELNAVKSFTDKMVAHYDENPPESIPSFEEIDKCIDFLHKLYLKYDPVFHNRRLTSAKPTTQYSWQQIFRTPWLED